MSSVSMHARLPRTSVLSILDWKQKLLKNGVASIKVVISNALRLRIRNSASFSVKVVILHKIYRNQYTEEINQISQ